jgi:CheY-like chemotaxis protein
MNQGEKFDLVLMDIIMPNLDGVSATHLIRQFDSTPIIAMTSNIRSDDISMYFQHGKLDIARNCAHALTHHPRDERCSAEAIHEGRSPRNAGETFIALEKVNCRRLGAAKASHRTTSSNDGPKRANSSALVPSLTQG